MTTILLTGAAGMIGTAVLRDLEATGATVWTSDRRPIDRDRHVVADLEDPDTATQLGKLTPEVTVHLSGAVGTGTHDLFTSNVLGTVRLLDALPRRSRVLIAGSAAEYGAGHGEALSEHDPLRPISPYGWAKVAQTSVAKSIALRRELQLSVVRAFNVFGPDLPPTTALGNMRNQLESIDDSGKIVVGRLDVVRDYVPVEFVSAVFCAVAADRDPPEAINACSGAGIRLGDVLEAMIELLDVNAPVVPDPGLATAPAAPSVVGDPGLAAVRYGLEVHPDPQAIARSVLAHTIA